ncbi:MAG TPA: Hsp20/alpha crystallin family protein, partial [Phycisphaerae bacterium]|nr:Hsp20/alpha crystallin family protein [Phycisphaerae bacterium]
RFGSGIHSPDGFRGEMERLFGNLMEGLSSWGGMVGVGAFPTVNAWEDDRNLYLEAELPGLKMDDLEITVTGNELTLKGERKGGGGADVTYHRRERDVGPFTRVLRLPVSVDAEKVEASLKAGVLTVTLPKAEAARLRKIQVKGA